MAQAQNIIAIVYDYDRTLSPVSMHNDVILPAADIDPTDFWRRVDELRDSSRYEDELAWLRFFLRHERLRSLSNADLERMGERLQFFPGLPQYFDEIQGVLADERYQSHSIKLEHYIVTSGLRAPLLGSALRRRTTEIFGCELEEDENGRVCWPKRIVSHTSKTQYLFRINKGLEYVNLVRDVNDYVPDEERRLPFRNIIYVGDGPTDVPCFSVVTNRGGIALAVYDPEDDSSFNSCMRLRDAKRVNEIAAADYRPGTHLRRLLEHYVSTMANRIVENNERGRQEKVIEAVRHQ